jgi:DNA-binding CsgD family transcriptional regulator
VSKVVLSGYLGDKAGGDCRGRRGPAHRSREREVLQLIAEGKTNKEVAHALSVSVNTVETHRKHIMEKLDLHNTAELVRFAIRTTRSSTEIVTDSACCGRWPRACACPVVVECSNHLAE